MLRQCGSRLVRSRRAWKLQQQRRSSSSSPTPHHDDTATADDWQWAPALAGRLLTALGLTHIVSEYGVELTLCEGPSMLPTIQSKGEIILVDRLTPRLHGLEGGCQAQDRVQQARQRQEAHETAEQEESWHQVMIPANQLPPHGKWRRFWTSLTTGISVGDVVVVQHPERQGTVCKRILGLPGDVVIRSSRAQQRRVPQSLLVIPDGHVWIEGDNSLNSSDSRAYGPVPAAMIVGRVLCRVWPLRGHALIERGARPVLPSPCSGSTILPAGYEGEEILKKVTPNTKE